MEHLGVSVGKQSHLLPEINHIVMPPNSNTFSDWRRTCHVKRLGETELAVSLGTSHEVLIKNHGNKDKGATRNTKLYSKAMKFETIHLVCPANFARFYTSVYLF